MKVMIKNTIKYINILKIYLMYDKKKSMFFYLANFCNSYNLIVIAIDNNSEFA